MPTGSGYGPHPYPSPRPCHLDGSELTVAVSFFFRQEIENLDTLTALEELWLGKNKITEMKVR